MPRLSVLHSHHSLVEPIDRAFAGRDVSLAHFVEPGLIARLTREPKLEPERARERAEEQLRWMAECGADSILITCTNFIAVLDGAPPAVAVPIINIDEPFFAELCERPGRKLLLFSNPATVAGTTARLERFAAARGASPQVEVGVIPDAFQLVLQGKPDEYRRTVIEYIERSHASDPECTVAVGQLSMSESAKLSQDSLGVPIVNPLDTLSARVASQLPAKASG